MIPKLFTLSLHKHDLSDSFNPLTLTLGDLGNGHTKELWSLALMSEANQKWARVLNLQKYFATILNAYIMPIFAKSLFVCMSGVFSPTQEFSTRMELSPVKGCKIWPMLSNHGYWAVRVL